jgi:hypothetical protein
LEAFVHSYKAGSIDIRPMEITGNQGSRENLLRPNYLQQVARTVKCVAILMPLGYEEGTLREKLN